MIPIVGAKSLIIQAYQLLTEHVTRLARWKSPKANAILNCLEVLVWAAFTGLLGQANLSKCVGQACGLGWATAALGGVLIQFTIWMAVCTYLEFRAYRENGDNNLGKPILLDQQGEP
ncbi:hypothetical protein GGS24DRAFT_447076 [Hypoxylon argillaceum]|nr:hypothetical protein GGS24DRAFT_447076 [Hypoxylon argillaceum]